MSALDSHAKAARAFAQGYRRRVAQLAKLPENEAVFDPHEMIVMLLEFAIVCELAAEVMEEQIQAECTGTDGRLSSANQPPREKASARPRHRRNAP